MGRVRRRGGQNPSYNQYASPGTRYGVWLEPEHIFTGFTPPRVMDYIQYLEEETCVDETHPGPPYRSGGPLGIFKYTNPARETRSYGSYFGPQGSRTVYEYTGGFWPAVPLWSYVPNNAFAHNYAMGTMVDPYSSITAYGATGWNRFRPGRPTADAGIFIGELGDLPRMLKTTAKGFHDLWRQLGGSRTDFGPKAVADHWLNTQFGWLPFVNDLKKFYYTYETLHQKMSRVREQNGRWQRVGGTVQEDSTHEVLVTNATQTGHWPSLPSPCYASLTSSGSYTVTRETEDRIWFEGSFRYWIPNIGSVEWEKTFTRQLFGLTISPSVVWELVPWSWLVDWFSNVGDVLANMDAGYAENLAARYAYVMRTSTTSVHLDSWCRLKERTLHDTWTSSITRKYRTAASPFGFGLTIGDLTNRQWSILSALGISKRW